jgi:thiamine kinase-like enzyme
MGKKKYARNGYLCRYLKFMRRQFKDTIYACTGAKEFRELEIIQELWSGYGKIVRLGLQGADRKRIVVKHIILPQETRHPRGWNTNLSHQRKVKSYQVETEFYKNFSKKCNVACYVPNCLAVNRYQEEVLIVLEDLNETGFGMRKTVVSLDEIKLCIKWLANFHACFLGEEPTRLWQSGTYWHLETRPDELEALDDLPLKNAAIKIDQKLKESPYQTFVHGDAKLANFCFSNQGNSVAAVDFQYVGGGCGMKDVAYFIGSCLYEDDCELYEGEILDYYFKELKKALKFLSTNTDFAKLEDNWRSLYPVAWTDFHRFMKGWSPGHWKIHSYSERLANEVIQMLSNN